MKLVKKSILLISPEPWFHIHVSKHHYAKYLIQCGNQVIFLNPPSSKWDTKKNQGENLIVLDYQGFPKGLRFLPSFVQKYFTLKNFRKIEKITNLNIDIVWSFDNSVFYRFDALPDYVIKLSHIVDLNQDFRTRQAAKTADICIGTTKLICEKLKKFNANTNQITHGFNSVRLKKDIDLPGQYSKKILYAGNLNMPYLDWNLIENVIQHNSKCDYIFLGPLKDQGNDIQKSIFDRENVFWIGKIDSNLLLNYYKKADLLIIFYQQKYHSDQANPHKMMEYLGSGTCIVATYTAEYEELAHTGLIAMSKNNREFLQAFDQVVNNLDFWNEPEKRKGRVKYALDNTYEKQIHRIEKLINEVID